MNDGRILMSNHLRPVSNFPFVSKFHYFEGLSWVRQTGSGYGGSNVGNFGGVQSEAREWMGREHSILIHLPPLATVALRLEK